MRIYYDYDKQDRNELTKRCLIRLLEEGNSEADVRECVEAGVDYYELSDFDYSNQCETAKQLFNDGKVSYVIYFEDDGYCYLGRVK